MASTDQDYSTGMITSNTAGWTGDNYYPQWPSAPKVNMPPNLLHDNTELEKKLDRIIELLEKLVEQES